MTILSQHTQDALHQARQQYRAQLTTRAAELEHWHRQASQGDSDSRARLLHHLHRLSGSAGLYGLNALGQQAKAAHRACKAALDNYELELHKLLSMMKRVARETPPAA